MDTNGPPSKLRVALRELRVGLFGMLVVLQKRHHVTTFSAYLGAIIKFLQMMNFIVSHKAHFHWRPGTVAAIQVITNPINALANFAGLTEAAYEVIYYMSLIWVTVFVGLTCWAVSSFIRNHFSALWPLKLLQAIGTFSASVLYIPLATFLFCSLSCHSICAAGGWARRERVEGGGLQRSPPWFHPAPHPRLRRHGQPG
jgi:hypothetical protein